MFDSYNSVQKAIFVATLRLINEKELQAASMSLISKESGISTGSIYYYFKSKEEIINELYKGIISDCTQAVLKDFDTDKPIKSRFNRAWKNLIGFCMNHSEAFQFIEQYSFSSYIEEATKKKVEEANWCGPLAGLYEEAIQQQVFVELNPQLMVQMHYGSVVYVLKAYFQKNVDLTDEVIEKIIAYCWNSVFRTIKK